MTRSPRHILLVLTAALALSGACVPAIAQAELAQSHLGELATKAQQEEESAAATTATEPTSEKRASESPLPGPLVLLGVGAAVVLLLGIAFVIVRDARTAAPVADGGGIASGGGSRNAEARLRRRRAQAKAARRQRKRNR